MDDIIQSLSKDPVMAKLVKKYPLQLAKTSTTLLSDLLDSIASQQLSVKAGTTIFNRFKNIYDQGTFPDARAIAQTSDEVLRACGLSYGKIKYIKGICLAVHEGNLLFDSMHTMTDEHIIAELTKLKGIGQWTAEMMLMSSFNRPDVFSVGDLGLRTAVSRLYNVDRDDKNKIQAISKTWKPYRSYACKLLWKSLDNS